MERDDIRRLLKFFYTFCGGEFDRQTIEDFITYDKIEKN